ncbi:translocation/assembly module TamB domain-containing protein [Ancylobacter sp. 6x-1]|uniref:Translocation/assembly module TamB domain-containing protein n=1 Tax=Ancylobacter crimeensis TaxID=2579147 RepID=A0ABT0DDR5_9HYPH|nr:translocation/assembly module TamB domain-containing protein [Ancylobacter crimeensis]MCK0198102.1 translocation/assembly module TamB domain-containing protein [Ancylobacter crimeensis]
MGFVLRLFSRILVGIGVTLLALVLLVAALFGLIQTPPGKAMLASVASSLASRAGLGVEISDISGFVPSDMTIGRIALADKDGTFATVERAHLSWSPLALLSQRVQVEDLSAAAVALLRKPEMPPAAPSQDTGGSSGGLVLPPIRVDRIAIDSIDLAEPVLGHAARLSLNGAADLASVAEGLSATLDLERHDAPGSLRGRLGYAPDTRILDLDLTAEEPEGGLVARAAQIEGLPAIRAHVAGKGPLDNWDGSIDIAAGDVARVEGTSAIRTLASDLYRVTLNLEADIAKVLPPTFAPLAAPKTLIAGTFDIDTQARAKIETLTVRSGALGGQVTGALDLQALTGDLAYSLTAGPPASFGSLLPVIAPPIGWESLAITGTAKGLLTRPEAVAHITGRSLTGAGYGAGTLDLTARTTPAGDGSLAVAVEGKAGGLSASDPKVASALGTSGTFTAAASVPASGNPVLTGLTVHLTGLTVRFDGHADPAAIAGRAVLERLDLATLSPLAGRPLAGIVAMNATIDASTDFNRAKIDLTGTTTDIRTGIAQLDGLLAGTARIAGGVERDGENAIRFNDLKVTADGLDTTMNGRLSRDGADLTARLALNDLARLDPRVSGAVNADAIFSGTLDDLGLKAQVSIPSGTAMNQKIQGLNLSFDGTDITKLPGGSFRLAGRIADRPATGSGTLTSEENGARQLSGLDIAIGSVTAKGDVTVGTDAIAEGQLAIVAGNLADLSALALTELGGKLDAKLTLSRVNGVQRAAIKGSATNVLAAGNRIGTAAIDLAVTDPAGTLVADGSLDLGTINAGGVTIPRARITAKGMGEASQITADGTFNDMDIAASALVAKKGDDISVRLDRANVSRGKTSLATTGTSNLLWSNGNLSIDRLALASGGGRATIAGRAGQQLDLTVDINALPAALAELAKPGLGLTGTISGNARLSGPASAPNGTYSLNIARLSTPDLQRAGTGILDIRADGKLANGRIDTRTTIGGRFLQGVTITGSAPLSAGELDLAIRGVLDLAAINPLLAASAQQVTGRATVDATVRGTVAEPRVGGTLRISGGTFNDGVTGVSLRSIEGLITGTDRSLTVSSLNAATTNGGSISANGSVALDPAGNFPGKINITVRNAGLVTSDLMRLVAEGQVALEGPLAQAPRVTGKLVLRTLDVNIAERLPGGVSTMNVRHVNVRPGQGSASPGTRKAQPPKVDPGTGIPLDLTVSAPNSVFVRGMGLDAQLGGDIHLTGTSRAPVAQGAFQMRRGYFNILGKRLTFTRGDVTFTGNLDPELDFVAETTANDITAQILVTGPASQPEVTFTSTPQLAQDEVLARLMFGRSAGSLTGGQALQVAQTIAQFSGGGSGTLDQMRRALGVDSLDVGTNAAGNGGSVGLGRRINDNLYLGVRQGTTPGSGQVTVDIDLTKRIRLQGATGSNGSTSVGIGAQWDYGSQPRNP